MTDPEMYYQNFDTVESAPEPITMATCLGVGAIGVYFLLLAWMYSRAIKNMMQDAPPFGTTSNNRSTPSWSRQELVDRLNERINARMSTMIQRDQRNNETVMARDVIRANPNASLKDLQYWVTRTGTSTFLGTNNGVAFQAAVCNGDLEKAKFIWNHVNTNHLATADKYKAFHTALFYGHYDMVQWMSRLSCIRRMLWTVNGHTKNLNMCLRVMRAPFVEGSTFTLNIYNRFASLPENVEDNRERTHNWFLERCKNHVGESARILRDHESTVQSGAVMLSA